MRSWFVDKLGAATGSLGDAEALKFGGRTEIGNLQANNVKVLGEPRQDPNVATISATFFEGPTGRIELTQR